MKQYRITVNVLYLLVIILLVTGCNDPRPGASTGDPSSDRVMLPGDESVLARVNGSPITSYDLEYAIRDTLGEAGAQLDESGRRKVLESLVAGRAIARAAVSEMTPTERAKLDKSVAAYREELLVKKHLSRHATPQPVTMAMVETYYEANPERFGAETLRSYEMILSMRKISPAERDALVAALDKAKTSADWQKTADTLRDKGYPVSFRDGRVSEKLLHPRLLSLMASLKIGEASPVSFIRSKAHLVKIVAEKKIPPRPLTEVSAEIRKSLQPVQLKNAVRQASTQVLETAEVVYASEETR